MTAQLPIYAVNRPTASRCDANGQLVSTRLASIGVSGRLEVTAARAWGALFVAMAADGWKDHDGLTYTYGGTYRTLAAQEALFHQRWEPAPDPASPMDHQAAERWHAQHGHVFYAGMWWKLKPGVARAAVPGTSNHGWGLAVDVALGYGPAEARSIASHRIGVTLGGTGLDWLLAPAPGPYGGPGVCNAVSFGWSWESHAEPWHLRYTAGDGIPRRVLDVEAFLRGLK